MNRLEKRALLNKIAMAAKAVLLKRAMYKQAEPPVPSLSEFEREEARNPNFRADPRVVQNGKLIEYDEDLPDGSAKMPFMPFRITRTGSSNGPTSIQSLRRANTTKTGLRPSVESFKYSQGDAAQQHATEQNNWYRNNVYNKKVGR